MPSGLIYTLAFESGGSFYKPIEVEDVHGNKWTIDYHSASDTEYTFVTGNGLINHPMIESVRDDYGRRLDFIYQTSNGKKRLNRIQLGSQILSRYTFQTISGTSYLQTHKTGENRTTTFTTTSTIAGKGTIKSIQMDTGGTMNFNYAAKTFYYRSGLEPRPVYAVTSHTHAGGTWNYQYPNSSPNNGIFSVTINGPEGFQGTYDYQSYDSDFSHTDLYLVGKMVSSSETRNSTTVEQDISYNSMKISNDLIVDLVHAEQVLIPRMSQSRNRVDGTWLTTDYTYSSSHLNFPTVVDGPLVRTDHDYAHRASNSRYLLGLPKSQTRKVGSSTISKTILVYPSTTSVNPSAVRLYTTSNAYDQVNLTYFTSGSGYKGMVRHKDIEGFADEDYTYQNGVLKKIDYPTGIPDINRTIHTNGTIASETSDGVMKTYTWDDDFRLRQITHPDDNIAINYTSNSVTVTQGTTWMKETYDSWGRLNKSDTRIDGSSVIGTHTVAYNALDEMIGETLPTGATYTYTYDVLGRMRTKDAGSINDDYTMTYQTASDGKRTTTTLKNNAIDSVVRVDALGRVRLRKHRRQCGNILLFGKQPDDQLFQPALANRQFRTIWVAKYQRTTRKPVLSATATTLPAGSPQKTNPWWISRTRMMPSGALTM